MAIRFHVGGIRVHRRALQPALDALVAANVALMTGRRFPPLYASGVRYRRERPGREDWRTADKVLAAGHGDCEDLAAYRAAELRLRGVPARARAIRNRTGWHIIVVTPRGVEDPSRRLGM